MNKKQVKASVTADPDSLEDSTSGEAKHAASKLAKTDVVNNLPQADKPAFVLTNSGGGSTNRMTTNEQKKGMAALKPSPQKHKRESMNTGENWTSSDADFSESEH